MRKNWLLKLNLAVNYLVGKIEQLKAINKKSVIKTGEFVDIISLKMRNLITLKNLYFILFFALIMLAIFLIVGLFQNSPSVYNWMSALLLFISSLLVLITFREKYDKEILDRERLDMSILQSAIFKIDFLHSKLPVYKHYLTMGKKLTIAWFKEFDPLFDEVMKLAYDRDLVSQLNSEAQRTIYKIHDSFFLIRQSNSSIIDNLMHRGLQITIEGCPKRPPEKIVKSFESAIEMLDRLLEELKKISNAKINNFKVIVKEEYSSVESQGNRNSP